MDQLVKTILFMRDGIQKDVNVDLSERRVQGSGREQVQLI